MKSSAFILLVPYVLGSWFPFGRSHTSPQPEENASVQTFIIEKSHPTTTIQLSTDSSLEGDNINSSDQESDNPTVTTIHQESEPGIAVETNVYVDHSMSVNYDDSIEKTSSTRSRSSYFYSGGSLNPLNWWYGSVPEQEDEDSSFEGYPAMFLSTSSSSSSVSASAQASGQSSDETETSVEKLANNFEKLNLGNSENKGSNSSDDYLIRGFFSGSSTTSSSSSTRDDIPDFESVSHSEDSMVSSTSQEDLFALFSNDSVDLEE